MKEQLIITFLTHLLKQHEGEPLTTELSDRLMQADIIHAENFPEEKRQPYTNKQARRPYEKL